MEIAVRTNPESLYGNLKTYAPNIPTDGAQIAVNAQFFAYHEGSGSGAFLGVLPLSSYGKNHIPVNSPAYQQPIIRAHSQIVQDFAFNPFHAQMLLTCSADKFLKIWDIPAAGLSVDITAPKLSMQLASKTALRGLCPHPAAEHLLALRSSREIGLIDLSVLKEMFTIKADCFIGDIQSFTWSHGGDVLLTTSKDKTVRLFDARSQRATASAPAHQGVRYSSCQWLGDSSFFLTAGHNSNERETFLWDARAMGKPIAVEAIDSGAGPLTVVYDEDVQVLYLSGRGDSFLRAYRFQDGVLTTVAEQVVNIDPYMKDPVRGLALLPKTSNDLAHGEVSRMLKLSEGLVQTVTIKDRAWLAEQSSGELLYSAGIPALSLADWVEGTNGVPMKKALTIPPPAVEVEEVVLQDIQPSAHAQAVPAETTEGSNTPDRSSSPVPSSRISRVASMGSVYKYRHMYGAENKKEFTSFNLSPDLTALDSPIIAANETYWAIPYRPQGGGGAIYISKHNKYGRVPHDCCVLNGHKTAVQDISFSPFHRHLMATGSIDSAIKLWDVDSLFVDDNFNEEACAKAESLVQLPPRNSSVRSVLFHPTVDRLLVSSAQDLTVRFHDVSLGEDISTISLGASADMIANMSFSFDGTLLATACKDRIVRILDPRLQMGVIGSTPESNMGRNLRVVWCGRSSNTDPLVTVAAGSGGIRQIALWDVRSLAAPVTTKSIDNASGQLFPMFDEGLNVVFVAGKGDTILRAYEIANLNAEPSAASSASAEGLTVLEKCMEFQNGLEPLAGVCMLPKRSCNVRNVEVARLLKLTKDSVSNIAFRVPRAEHLKAYFHDDIYLPTRSTMSKVTVDDWVNPETPESFFQPELVSLQPEDMMKVSEKPAEPTPSQSNSKVSSFRESMKLQQEEEKQREESFAKLQKLAVQNAQYHVNLSGVKKIGGELAQKTAAEEDEDSDDGWND